VHLVTAESAGGAKLGYFILNFALQCLKPGELIHTSRKLLKESDNHRANGGVTLGGRDPRVAVNLIGERNRQVLHRTTVTQNP